MKILIFNTLYLPNQVGGAEKSVQLLAEGLVSLGHDVSVVSTSDETFSNILNGVKVYYVNVPNLYWCKNPSNISILKPFWHLIDSCNPFLGYINKIINDEKPDVIHTNNLAGLSVNVWRLAKKNKIKIVHTLRDYYLLCPKSTMYHKNKKCDSQCFSCKMYSLPKKYLSRHVDNIVGISKFVLDKHLSLGYFQNAKSHVIGNSIEIPKKNSIKEKNSKITTFGYVGRLEKSKGIEWLIEQFNNIACESVILEIYGKSSSNEYYRYLENLKTTPFIIFKGRKPIENIYPNIDTLIVPSLWNEPFGRIIVEANSYSVPVIVSSSGGMKEMIINGKNGFVYHNKEEFIGLINRYIQGNDFQISNDIINDYSIKNISTLYSKVYK